MKQTIIITKNPSSFSPMEKTLLSEGFTVSWADSAASALKDLSQAESPVNLVIVGQDMDDMNPREFTENLARLSPMTNSAIESGMDHEKFHDEFEGLGVLMQLSSPVTSGQALELLEILKKIGGLLS